MDYHEPLVTLIATNALFGSVHRTWPKWFSLFIVVIFYFMRGLKTDERSQHGSLSKGGE